MLESLLEDERIVIEGISGSSAGAINGTVLAHDFATGGREGGIRVLISSPSIRADAWLRRNFRYIGTRSSFELSKHHA